MSEFMEKEKPESSARVKTVFPFRPLNGYLVVTDDRGNAEPKMGTVLAVCDSLAGKVFTGDRILWPGDGRHISYGPANALLVNVDEIYGIWDIDRVHKIDSKQIVEGKIVKETEFEV